MCLLCEELWMPFEPAQSAKPRTFVADSPKPDEAAVRPRDTADSRPQGTSSDEGTNDASGSDA